MQTTIPGPLESARRYWRMSLVRGIIAILFGLMAIFWPSLTFKLFFVVFGVFAVIEGCLLIASAFAQKRNASRESTTYQQESPYRRDAAYQAETQRQRNASFQRDTAYQAEAQHPHDTPSQQNIDYQAENPYQRESAYQRDPAHQTEYGARPTNWLFLLGEGVLSVICGLLCILLPTAMAVVALYVVAIWALIEGIGALMQMRTRGWIMGVIGILAIILAIVLFLNPIGAIRSFLWIVGIFALIAGVLMVIWSLYQNSRAARQERPLEPA